MKKYIGIGLLLALVLAGMGGREALAREKQKETIHTGVYADEIDLSGMTVEEAEQEVLAYMDRLGEETLTLEIFDEQVQVTLGELGLECTNLKLVEEAAQLG